MSSKRIEVFAGFDSTDRSLPESASVRPQQRPMFNILPWHTKYAQALLVSSIDFPKVVVVAEQAILDRYLALLVAESKTDELDDLRKAMRALSQRKESDQNRSVHSRSVA